MKKAISLLLSLILCLWAIPLNVVSFAADNVDSDFLGSGTSSDPFQIDSAYKLRLLYDKINEISEEGSNAKYKDAYFIQTVDIDLQNKTWTPIGSFTETADSSKKLYFAGHYDGNYHSIKNLTCNSNNNYVGLFGRLGENGTDYTDKCVISNLSVYGNVSSKGSIVGGIVGELCTGATIENCCFYGDVSGESSVGGIAGMTYNGGYIKNCYHNGSVIAANNCSGGVIGSLRVGNYEFSVNAGVYNSYHTGGNVTATNGNVGGIVGLLEYGEKKTNCTITLENNYYLSSTCNGGYNGEDSIGYQKLSEEMWSSANELLGSPYVADNDNSNGGYPVFEWQSKPYQFIGSGTKDDPYQISSKNELKTMRDLVNSQYFSSEYANKCYIQTADINLNSEDWTPIGTRMINNVDLSAPLFTGSYYGNSHYIRNLYINETDGNRYTGLFGSFRGNGVISDLVVTGNVYSNGNCVGGIAGEVVNGGGIIKNCAFIGDVSGTTTVGGIAGVIYGKGSIEGCYHIGNVSSSAEAGTAGGIAGEVNSVSTYAGNSTITNCYNIGKVSGTSSGSIVGTMKYEGENAEVNIINSYSIKDESPVTPNGTYKKYDVTAVTVSMLQDSGAKSLGENFVKASNDSINSGYPVFSWQQSDILMGDANNDGKFNITDVVLLQKWLLTVPNTELANWKAVDFYDDNRLDVFDLTLAKRALIESGNIDGYPTSITLNKSSATLDIEGSGNSIQLTASILPANVLDKSVTWTSSNTKVATVSSSGLVTAVGSGTAIITAKTNLGGKAAICQITVANPSISITPTSASIYVGGTSTITAKAIPSTAAVSWKSDNTAIATVSNGKITAVKAGTANITASITVNGKTYTSGKCVVTVTNGGIALNKTSATLYPAGSETLTATTNPKDQAVTWSTSNANIVTVSGGKITAVAAGSATITAKTTINGVAYSATCQVTVTQPSVKLNKSSTTLYIAGSETLTATVVPSGSAVTWKSSNTAIATVSGGKITAVAKGTANITASITVNGKTYTSSACAVTVKTPTISLSKSSHSMWIGDSVTLTASTDPGSQTITWKSSNTGVATVSGGKITGVSNGTANITASITVNGKTYTSSACAVTINKPYVTLGSTSGSSKDDHVYYSSSTGGFYAGIFNLPSATATPSGSVSWSVASGNASINSGKLMINQPGTVVARASFSYGGKTYTADYTYTRTVTFYAGSAFTLRSGASTSTSSLGSIPKGTSLTVASLDYSDSKYVWGKVTYNGKTGYVALWLKNRSEANGIITV